MIEIQCFLEKWQTLIGSILGGVFALFAALIVAISMRRREEIASGMLVVGNLVAVRVANEMLEQIAKEKKIPEQEYHLWFSERLIQSHPPLSALFEASLIRLMPVNVSMAAHLSLFHSIYLDIKIMLERLSDDYKHFHKNGKPIRPKEHMEADARLITHHFKLAVQLALCAEHLISHLVLHKYSLFHRLRYYFYQNQKEKDCSKLLKEGSSS